MKLKRITTEKQLIAGCYIRVYISPEGRMDVGTIQFKGKPRCVKNKFTTNGLRVIEKVCQWRFQDKIVYLADMACVFKTRQKKRYHNTALFKYSPKVFAYLKGVKDLEALYSIVNGREINVADLYF